MSLVSTRLALTHRCTVERITAGDADDWGQPPAADWEELAADVPCRVWGNDSARDAFEGVTDGASLVTVDRVFLIVPLGTDVTEQDRIASVTWRGRTVQDGPLGVRAIVQHRDFLQLTLVKIG